MPGNLWTSSSGIESIATEKQESLTQYNIEDEKQLPKDTSWSPHVYCGMYIPALPYMTPPHTPSIH